MTTATRATYAARMPERELQQLVTDLCRLLGLPHFHVRHSTGMTAGWPDSVIIGTKVIYRELKSEHGQLSPEQRHRGQAQGRRRRLESVAPARLAQRRHRTGATAVARPADAATGDEWWRWQAIGGCHRRVTDGPPPSGPPTTWPSTTGPSDYP
jgi:hypothetical protein